MIQLIKDLPEHVVGIELTGEVSKEEYHAVYAEVEKLARREGTINYLVVVNTEVKNLAAGVW